MRLFTILNPDGSLILAKDRSYLILRTLGLLRYFQENCSVFELEDSTQIDINSLFKTNNEFAFKSKTLPVVINMHTISKQSLRLFACDCAERVLHIFENEYPKDKRPRKVIETARKYAYGLATKKEFEEVKNGAPNVVYTNSVAWSATCAARGDAWCAADNASWSVAARNAEIIWQEKRLEDYLDGKVNIQEHLT